jgi:hypothetical protein
VVVVSLYHKCSTLTAHPRFTEQFASPTLCRIREMDASCTICLGVYNAEARKPWDIGCGHCVCEECFEHHGQGRLTTCPECRQPVRNPHLQYAMLRLLERRVKSFPIGKLPHRTLGALHLTAKIKLCPQVIQPRPKETLSFLPCIARSITRIWSHSPCPACVAELLVKRLACRTNPSIPLPKRSLPCNMQAEHALP